MFNQADRDDRIGVARKTKPVDVRPAEPGCHSRGHVRRRSCAA
jgi:hypothetical protein